MQNVGAYGQEASEVLIAVRAYDRNMDRIIEEDRKNKRARDI